MQAVQNRLRSDVAAAKTPPEAVSRSGTPRADLKAASFIMVWLVSSLVPGVGGFFKRETSSLMSFSMIDKRSVRLDEQADASASKKRQAS